jgi:ABC-type sugar transport system ATPase subunit
VLRTSHRIVVLRDKKMVKEFTGEVGSKQIMHAMAGDD